MIADLKYELCSMIMKKMGHCSRLIAMMTMLAFFNVITTIKMIGIVVIAIMMTKSIAIIFLAIVTLVIMVIRMTMTVSGIMIMVLMSTVITIMMKEVIVVIEEND